MVLSKECKRTVSTGEKPQNLSKLMVLPGQRKVIPFVVTGKHPQTGGWRDWGSWCSILKGPF